MFLYLGIRNTQEINNINLGGVTIISIGEYKKVTYAVQIVFLR